MLFIPRYVLIPRMVTTVPVVMVTSYLVTILVKVTLLNILSYIMLYHTQILMSA